MTENILHSTTQKFLDIFDITNNMVILKDGTCSLLIQVDAMNFGLLAEEEQDSIMYSYAGLLNSLNYPIQIIVHSQTKDVTGYLQILKDQEDQTQSRTQQQRIRRYREFVSNLIRERNVLDKKFYVTISATPLELGILAPQSILPGQSNTTTISGDQRTAVIEKARNLLEPKRDHLLAQFARIGLFARQLATQEIIQFFYVSYNPEAAEGQQIADTSNYTTPMVTAGVEGITMNTVQDPTMNQPLPVAQAAVTTLEQVPHENPLPSPVPEPASIPPQLSPDAPFTPPSEITVPTQAVSTVDVSTQAYVPTQMPSATPTLPAQTPAFVNTPPVVSPAPEQQLQPNAAEVSSAAPVAISPETTSAIQQPEVNTDEMNVETPLSVEPESLPETPSAVSSPDSIQETSQTQPETPQQVAATPPATESKTTVPGPTLDSTSGFSNLPKPTLPPIQNQVVSPVVSESVPTDTSAIQPAIVTTPDQIEPVVPEVAATTSSSTPETSQDVNATPAQNSGDNLPPLPEI